MSFLLLLASIIVIFSAGKFVLSYMSGSSATFAAPIEPNVLSAPVDHSQGLALPNG